MYATAQGPAIGAKGRGGSDEELPLSGLLRALADGPGESVTVGEMMDFFGHRAFGAVLFVFSAPNMLPLPPGSSSVLGAPLVLIAPQVALGRRTPWLPKSVSRRAISRKALAQAFNRLIPPLTRVEKVSRPRLPWLFGSVGDRVIGAVCTILALILILPIPFGNLLPAAAISALSLGLVTRDGIIALAGYLLTGISGLVLFLTFSVVISTLKALVAAVGVQV